VEHVVFFSEEPGQPEFRRVADLDEAVRFVESLRNERGVVDVAVHALTPVPLSFRTWYRVEVGPLGAEPVDPVAVEPAPDESPAVESFAVESFAVESFAVELDDEPAEAVPVESVPVEPVPVEPTAPEAVEADASSLLLLPAPVAELPASVYEVDGEPFVLAAPFEEQAADEQPSEQEAVVPSVQPEHSLGYFAH
jgi:hypothetical protein